FSENLTTSVVTTTGGVTTSGTQGALAAQASGNALTLGFSTATAGTIAGTVKLDFQSDGTGIDGFAAADLGQQTVAVNATVDNFAKAGLQEVSGGGTWSQSGNSYTLNLGSVAQGAAPGTIKLSALNTATGIADVLGGSFTTS